MKKVLMVLICLTVLTSCATTNMTTINKVPSITAIPDEARLVIIRETFYGSGVVFKHYLDDQMIGETSGFDYFITSVTPGSHYFITEAENTTINHFDFKPGKTYLLGQGVTMGVWMPRSTGLYPMTVEAAENAMKKSDYKEYSPKTRQENIHSTLYQEDIDAYLEDVRLNPEGFKDVLNYDGVFVK